MKLMNDNQTPLSLYCRALYKFDILMVPDYFAVFNRASVAEIQGFLGPEIIIHIVLCSLFPEGSAFMKWDVSICTDFVKAPMSFSSLEVYSEPK